MSQFQCLVVRVEVTPHPNADAIELAKVGDYISIIKKGQLKTGDLAVYLPEQAVLPEWLLRQLGFWDALNNKGTLTSSAGNRIKAIKLRGILSQGLLLTGLMSTSGRLIIGKPFELPEAEAAVLASASPDAKPGATVITELAEGDDAAEFLGVTKYEPPLPVHMAGNMLPQRNPGEHLEITIKYDFENIKKTPYMFQEGEEVVFTEKLHGTLAQFGVVAEKYQDERFFMGRGFVTSKGVGARGFILDPHDATNLYASYAIDAGIYSRIQRVFGEVIGRGENVVIFGEIFGDVQDLKYGHKAGDRSFNVFDIYIGTRNNGRFLGFNELERCVKAMELKLVPVLYRGPYSKELMLDHTDGKTTIGNGHIREGIVVKSVDEGYHFNQRKIAKSISEAYLLRKSAEATEFQ